MSTDQRRSTLRYEPLPAALSEHATRTFTDEAGGSPLRCCLRDSRPGERIVGGEVVRPGTGQEEVAARLLADAGVAFLQTRNVVFGCYMLTIRRAPDVAVTA
jgi:hypothetical protein